MQQFHIIKNYNQKNHLKSKTAKTIKQLNCLEEQYTKTQIQKILINKTLTNLRWRLDIL